jgi:hypothetical protein
MIEKVTKYTSFLSLLFFIGAVWYEFIYYESFGIDIFTYISLSEIIVLFISSIPSLLGISILVFGWIYLLMLAFSQLIKKLSDYQDLDEREKRRISSKNRLYIFLVFDLYILVQFGPLLIHSNQIIYSETFFLVRIIVSLLFFFQAIIFAIAPIKSIQKHTLYLILFVITFLGTVYYLASYQLWIVKNDPKRIVKVSIQLNDSSQIISNDSTILIGKTNNHVFIYNSNKIGAYSTVIPIARIQRINYYTKLTWYHLP